jgi:hypothetical protein
VRKLPGPLYPYAITALCAALLFGACGGGDLSLPPEGQPASVSILEGDKQSGRVGEPLALPLLIQVSDSRGEPVAGATVAFEFSSAGPGAVVVPEQKTTNSAGQADAQLVLGTTVGPQAGQVRVVAPAPTGEPVQASFSAMALSENANSMAAAGGQDQTGHVLQPLDDRLVVEVTDGFGNPVAGVPITWAAAGGGSVSADIVPTDEDGRSRVDRILGPTVGQQTTLASSEGLAGSPVVFVHTAIAGDASRLTIVSGDGQTGAVGTPLPAELVVRLIDSEGNGVPNTAVTWVPAIGGGAPNPLNTTTDNDGRTSTQWILGPALGDQRMDAVVSGVGVASFTATATAGAPASLFIRTQPSPTARNGIPFERQPVVQLRDPQGNDVAAAGVQVTVALNGGGELEGTTRQITDASGRATFTDLAISGAPGTRTLVFEAVGFAPVTSNGTAVSAIGTTTAITGDLPDPSQVGTPFTVSFRVASIGPTPAGNVTVGDGVQSCVGALSNGAGSCQLSLTTVGGRTLTATYAGTPGLTGSSDTEAHTVTAAPPPPPASTTTTITADTPDPSIAGSTVTVSFQVTSGGGNPTGSVTVSEGTATCSGSLSGGIGSCQLELGTVGDRTLTASYGGATGFSPSSDTEGHTVTSAPPPPPASTSTTITSDSPDPSENGASVVVSFQVTSSGGTPNGSVTVTSSTGGGSCTGTLSGGTGSCELTITGVGERTLTATYSGAPGFSASSDEEGHTVTAQPPPPPASTATTITSDNPDPSISGATVTVNFQVTSDGGGTPTGSVTVGDGSTSCTSTLSGGTGSCQLTLSPEGDRTLTATYSGAEGFSSSSDTEGHTVVAPSPVSTTTAIISDNPDPSVSGSSFTVGFRVASAGATPTGTVTVSDGTSSCTGTLAAGEGSCDLALGTVGDRTLTATYSGADGFEPSSDTEGHTVTAPPPASTTTTITGDAPDPSEEGQTVTVSFTVTSSSGTPDGTVDVSADGGGSCSATVAQGSCTLAPGAGTTTLTAEYGGSAGFTASSDTESHAVNPPPPAGTTTSIRSINPEPSVEGEAITVVVEVQSSAGTPDGTVAVSDGSASCEATLSGGVGSCEFTPAGSGPRTISATYPGNTRFATSTGSASHTVDQANSALVARIGSITCTGMNCSFTNDSTDPNGADTIAGYRWVFGDEATSSERNPSHASV